MEKLNRKIGLKLLLIIFIFSSFNKIFNFSKTLQEITNKNLPFPLIALICAIGFQLFGISGILFYEYKIINHQLFRYSKYLLIIFTILATYYYHNIFTMHNQTINFFKNISIIGGLLLI